MPTITAQGKTFDCDLPSEGLRHRNANLRQALLDNDIDLYSPRAKYVNCMGIGTCGTCAVQIEGKVSAVNWRDKARRSLPPHHPEKNLRLACQTQVLGDIHVTKFEGFWGHKDRIAWKAGKNDAE